MSKGVSSGLHQHIEAIFHRFCGPLVVLFESSFGKKTKGFFFFMFKSSFFEEKFVQSLSYLAFVNSNKLSENPTS